MSYYAKVFNNLVTNVIVCDPSFLNTYIDGAPGNWIETFMDGMTRGNYAGIGYTYDAVNNVFYPPQPYPSWTLSSWKWIPPTPYPSDDKMYLWDEMDKLWTVAN